MRILMLAQFYAPTIGGEERHVQDLGVELLQRGHDVAVATLWHPGTAPFEIDQGVRVHRIKSSTRRTDWLFSEQQRRHAPPFPDPEALLGLYRVLESERPDVVHAHNWFLYSYLPLKILNRTPLVVTLHDYSFSCSKKRLMYQGSPCSGPALAKCLECAAEHYGPAKGVPTVLSHWTMNAAARIAVDMFIPVSQATAAGNGLVGSGLPYQVIPNFVPDGFGTQREALDHHVAQLPEDEYLLFVGDLTRDKGIHVLLRAYAGLTDAPPLVLIGRLCSNTPATFPENVVYLGSWPHAAVMEAWRRSSIALVPSIWPEPFGIVAIEAMAAGRPVIASRIGGLCDIVSEGETGLLVPPGEPVALRQALERLLTDPARREAMGRAARRKVTEFHASTVIPRIEDVYRSVRAKARSRETAAQPNDEEEGISRAR